MPRPLARAACAAALATLLATTPAKAAGCAAIDYQRGLAGAADALQRSPADVAAARTGVAGLLQAYPGSRAALAPVLDELSTSPPIVEDARLRLASMSSVLAHPAGSTCNQDTSAARAALHDVYASAAMQHLDDTTTQAGPLDGVLRFLADLVGSAAGALGPLGAALLALLVLGAATLLAWRRWRGAAAFAEAAIAEPATWGDDPDAEWRAAQRAAGAGDHREAVRRAFRAVLLDVAGRGRLHVDAAWTTRELLERIHADGEVLAALASAAALFNRAWYSGLPVTAADWSLAEVRCTAVRRLARHAGAVAR